MESCEYLGSYTLWQSESCFKLGRDSILLSRFATIKAGQRVGDLGCGIGSLLLLLSQGEERSVGFVVEIEPCAAEEATRNL